jgi:hypothetical protein
MLMSIEIEGNIFKIIRYEGLGYVHNKCKYDKNIFELETFSQISELEGGSCEVIYKFKILKRKNSFIKFKADYGDYKYYDYYFYDPKLNSVSKINNNQIKKCIIL